MKEFLTIKEVQELSGKSESTVRRMTRQLKKIPKEKLKTEIIKHYGSGNNAKILIEKEFVIHWSNGGQIDDYTNDQTSEHINKHTPLPDNEKSLVIKILREQLERKDEQLQKQADHIEKLQESAREAQKLLSQEQQLHLLTQTKLQQLEAPQPQHKPKEKQYTEAQTIEEEEPDTRGDKAFKWFVGLFTGRK